MARKTETIEHLDASISRWKTRLKRAMTALDKLEKQRKRLAKRPVEKVVVFDPEIKVTTIPGEHRIAVPVISQSERLVKAASDAVLHQAEPDLGIPAFLRRDPAVHKAVDDAVAETLRKEIAETKKAKAAGRIAKMKAKKAGDLKKMPLSGKAALDAIKNG